MKKKQKFQKFLNSVVKSHGDIEEDRKEIENDVKKMLELFENNSEDVSDRYDFVSLVNDMKKRYLALYGRHDGLIGKIKNKVHHKKGESRSGPSDSGSEDSSDEDGPNEIQGEKMVKQLSLEDYQYLKEQVNSLIKQNAELEAQSTSMQTKMEENQHLAGELISRGTIMVKLEDELQTARNSLKLLESENEVLKTEMEKSKERESMLSLEVTGLREENEVLLSEKEKDSSTLLQADNSIVELKFELEKMMEDSGKLREDNSFLKKDLKKKAQEMVHLNEQMVLTGEERETLRAVVTELESVNDSLKSENERALFDNQNLKVHMEVAIQQVSNHNDKLLMLEGENDALNSQVLKFVTNMHEADETIKDMTIESGLLKENLLQLHDTITDLNLQLKVKEEEKYAMALESTKSRQLVEQAEERIMILSVEAERLKSENSMLLAGHKNLKIELEGNNQDLSNHKQSLEAAESKMNSLREESTLLLSWQENLKLELERNNQELSKTKQALETTEYEKKSLIEEKTALLSKINEGGLVIDGLNAQIEEVEIEKSQLQLKINNLDLERQSADFQFNDVKNALVTTEEEKKALVSENSVVKAKLQEAEFTKEILQTNLGELNQKNSILLSKIEETENEMIIESRLLKEDASKLHDAITDLNHQLKVKNDENFAMTLEFSESNKLFQQAEEKNLILLVEAERVKSENSMLLAGHENLKIELEGNNQDLSNHKQSLEAAESKMNSLREESTLLLSWQENLKLELERNNQELSKIKQALETTEYERNSLFDEKKDLLSKINEDGLVIDGLNSQIEEAGSEKSQLQLKINNLNLERQSADLQFNDVKNAFVTVEEEKKALVSENSVVKAKLQEAEFMKEILQTKLGELNQKNSFLLSKIEETEKEMIIESRLLKEDASKLHDAITDLNHQLKVKNDENYAMTLEISEFKRLIQQAEEKNMILSVEAEKVKSENSMLLAGHENLKLELEGNNQELSKHKLAWEATESEMNSLREGKSLLLTGHEDLKLELEGNNRELSKLNRALQATEFERNSLIDEKSALLNKINEGGMANDGLKAQLEEVESEKSQLQLKISNLDLEIQSANLQFTIVKNALAAAEEEKNSLVSKKLIVESKLQEAESMKERLQNKVGGLNQKNSILLRKIEEAHKDKLIESSLLKEDISKLNDTITDLNHQLKVKDDENYAMALESSESRKVIELAEGRLLILSVESEKMKSENSILLTERENLRLVLENNNQELSEHKQALEAMEIEINSLKEENSLMLSGHEILKLELEGNKQALEATNFERNSLIEVKSSLLTKINEGGMAIDGLKALIEELASEKCQLQQKISNLDLEIKSANLQFTNVTNALLAAEEEKKALVLENSLIKSKLDEAKLRIQTELGELNQKNSILLSKIEEAEKAANDFKFERDGLIADNAQLKIKVKELITELELANIRLNQLEKLIPLAEDEKTKFISEISILTGKLQLTEADNEKLERERGLLREENAAFQQNQGLQNKMVDHYAKLEVTLSEMQGLKDKLELAQKEVLREVQTWSDTFKGDLLEMATEKGDLDQELKKLGDISSENSVLLKKLEDILRSKISDEATLLKSYEQLLTKHKQLEDSYYESCANLGTAEKKFEQIEMKEEIIQRLERICAEQKNDISKWGENCRELLEKLSSTEAGKVDAEKEIQRLEVQFRLSNQKLKITETEYKEKEDNHKRLVAELQEELRLLDRYVLTWSRRSTELNNEFKQIKLVLETGMGTLVNELHEMESMLLENMEHIKKQLAECLAELQNLKTSLKSELHEKEKLKNENHELAVGLTYKEGIILKLKDEASRNLAHLAEKEKDLRILESRVAESEKNLKEKELMVLDKDEEKREAIRQLCLVIEYHWENRNDLVRYLSSVLRNRGTS